ncbi:MAG: hypothetical protein B6D53_02655 [Candidatus Omnitrophica bacterium 4484_49]|nr:hypothetical protein [Candidatus Omnitrophota bacterium]OQX83350.1 MAG: hypothetical protein B6D53_02655 [Candidatus Omnitrophica bacterium 4484_49]
MAEELREIPQEMRLLLNMLLEVTERASREEKDEFPEVYFLRRFREDVTLRDWLGYEYVREKFAYFLRR